MTNLTFPIVCYIDGVLTPDGGDFFNYVAHFLSDGRLSKKENRFREMRDGWIIDHNGVFIELSCAEKVRVPLHPILGRFFSSVRYVYDVSNPRQIMVSELADLVAAVDADLGANDKDLITDLNSFLASQNQTSFICKEIWDQWPL